MKSWIEELRISKENTMRRIERIIEEEIKL